MVLYKHMFQIWERYTDNLLYEGIYETDTSDWYYARNRIVSEYRDLISSGIDWYVDSVLVD